MKPLLFLDVDGVLNVLPHEDSPEAERVVAPPKTDAGRAARHEGNYARVPIGVRERLLTIWPLYEVIWATAWMGSADPVFCPWLGVESCDYLRWDKLKLPHIVKRAGDRRWAWVDDDAGFELDQLHWQASYVKGLIMAPDTNVGLTDDHVATLVRYARAE